MTEFLTMKQIPDALKVSNSTIARLYRSGVLPGHKVGRQVRISFDAVRSYLANTSNIQEKEKER